jgi:hypothetical protein
MKKILGFTSQRKYKNGMLTYKNLSSKLATSYYIMQSLKVITSVNILRSMYFVTFHLHLAKEYFGGGDGKSKKFLMYKRK